MLLHELQPGKEVILQLIIGNSKVEIGTSVVGRADNKENRILLKPFVYKGDVLDLGGKAMSKVVYNLFADDSNQERVCWAGVEVEIKEYRGESYYIVKSKAYKPLSVPNDRRTHNRIELHLLAVLTNRHTNDCYNVEIKDISDNGIGFFSNAEIPILQASCRIEFSEHINDNLYNLKIDCRCVREQKLQNRYLYGCEINEASHQMLAYVYIKKLMEKQEKMEHEHEMVEELENSGTSE